MVKKLLRAHAKIPFLLQPALAARFVFFARQRSYGYASLQKITNRTR
jgi:hypothetical protein